MSDSYHVYVVEIKSGRHKGLQAVTHDRDEATSDERSEAGRRPPHGRADEPLADLESPADPGERISLHLLPYSNEEWLLIVRNVTRLSRLAECQTLWLTATVNVKNNGGTTPLISPSPTSATTTPLPFG